MLIRWSALLVVLLAAGPSLAQVATAPSRQEIAHFLASARIVSSKDLPKGVTRPVRVTLTDGVRTHDAVFSTVDERVAIMRFKTGRTELDFVDSYKYNVAAYRLAELLGVDDMMPVTVEREWKGRKGSLTWWLDAQFDEDERRKRKIEPPDAAAWARQVCRMKVFAQLVGDTDRNLGNVLVGPDWQLYMIDFTRAFRRSRQLGSAADVTRCERRLLSLLRALTKEQVVAATHPYIGGAEVEALLARRDLIVERIEELVAKRGEDLVLF